MNKEKKIRKMTRKEYDTKRKELTKQFNEESDLNRQWLILKTIRTLNQVQRSAEWMKYERLK